MNQAAAKTDELTGLIAPLVRELGFELVRVQLSGAAGGLTLQVMAEDTATGQLTLEQCAAISRKISEMLDKVDPIEDEYHLEVSSPGIDRPLTRLSDFARWAGHEVRGKLAGDVDGRKRIHGIIGGVDGEAVSFDLKDGDALTVKFADIESAKLVLTDKLLKATRPLDASGADDLIEFAGEAEFGADNDNDPDRD